MIVYLNYFIKKTCFLKRFIKKDLINIQNNISHKDIKTYSNIYKAREGRCQKTKMARKGYITYVNNDFELLPENDNDSLVAAIQNQPVSVAIDRHIQA